ncbi:hypothetical protein HBH89_252320 [Parastagonospora nodorum]|nr:hypothetical protein HBH89_252320 [Parastagonospora nodorum]
MDRLAANKLPYLAPIAAVYLNCVYNIEVYDATAALQYNVTNVVLREKVLLGFNSVKGNITRSNCRIFNDGCNDSNSNSDAKM